MRSLRKRVVWTCVVITAVVAIVATAGCSGGGSSAAAPIVVGSKIDGEGALLGQMIIAVLEKEGLEVTDKTRTGATDVVRKALLAGQIDIYPEYTANGLLAFNKDKVTDQTVLKDADKTYQTAKALDEPNGVVWLQPAPANNTWAVAVPKAFSDANGVRTMEDWAAYINGGGKVKIVGSQEFFTSAAAMPAFEAAYGFKLKADQVVALATGDTAVTEKAAAEGANGANAAMAYGTDGTIAALDLVVLGDPKGAQPVYQPAPTVRRAVLDAHPEIATVLDPVFAKLTLETLQDLNGQIAIEGKDAKTVATDWLRSEGLIE